MKARTLLAAAALALSAASEASAQTKIYISGAPALRQSFTTAIEALVDAGGGTVTRYYNGSNIITANVVTWSGATIAGNAVTIKLTYNGSAGGYQAVAGSKTVRFLPDGLTAGGGQTDVLTNTSAAAEDAVPDFSIADEYQVSTPWIGTNNIAFGPNNSTYSTVDDRIDGIIPF